MASFNFYCRQSKADKNGFSPIELSIIIAGKRSYLALPRKEKPKDFARALASKRTNDIVEYVNEMRHRVNLAITEICKNGTALTPTALKMYLITGGVKSYTISNLFDDCFKLLSEKCEPLNYSKYCLVRDEFYTHINPELEASEITNAIVQSFYNKLSKEYKPSTAAGKMTKLKMVVKFGLDNGKLSINPFSTIKISKAKASVEYLTDEEVERIKKADVHCERLANVRDLFIFQCGSGLAYADLVQVRAEDIQEENGTLYIRKSRQKTEITYTSVLLPWAIEILQKHNGVLPTLSNQKMNAFLKEIAIICGINKNLHSHLARKTYCTHLLNSGCRIEVVSKCAGHSNTVITSAVYAHLQTQTIIQEVASVINKEKKI